MFNVVPPDKERLIFIFSDNFDEPEEFITLLKAYRDKLQGKIVKLSDDMQYSIDNDELGLVFQWDSCFGITVIVPESADLNKAYDTLNEFVKAFSLSES